MKEIERNENLLSNRGFCRVRPVARYFSTELQLFICLLFFFLPALPLLRAQEADDFQSERFFVVGELNEGVYDLDGDSLVVDTVFQQVRIMNDNLFECSYSRWIRNGEAGVLPAPVIEYYDADGTLTLRSYTNLLANARFPYEDVRKFAEAYELKDLQSAVYCALGDAYESMEMYREAYQYFKKAYRRFPSMTAYKMRADAIMSQVNAYQRQVRAEIAYEDYLQRVAEAEQRARNEALAASLQSLSYSLGQLKQTQSKSSQPVASAPKKSAQTGKKSVGNDSKSKNEKSIEERKRELREKQHQRDLKRAKEKSSGWNYEWITCYLCNGGGHCIYCYNGKVNGTTVCSNCKGTNICQRCKGNRKTKELRFK